MTAIVVWVFRLVLAILFVVAGLAKLVDRRGARRSLVDFGLSDELAAVFSIVLPVSEIGLALALIPAASVQWAAIGLALLLLLFIAAIAVNLSRGKRPDCRCFGQIHSTPVGATTIWRNGALAILAAVVYWQAPVAGTDALWVALQPFGTGLPAALAVLVVLLALQGWCMVILLRQSGRLQLRIKKLEEKLGAEEAEEKRAGLPIGAIAPPFRLRTLDGEMVTLADLEAEGRPVLLVFTEPGCGVCETQFPEVAQWQKEHADTLTIALLSSGREEANRHRRDQHALRRMLLQEKHEVADAYQSHGTPAAVLIRDGKIASKLAEGTDAIRTVVARATLPPQPEQGEPVPSLILKDLAGREVDLGALRGHPTLLLFWNPECGFCEGMLADLQTQEKRRVKGAPELLIISSGSAELIRGQSLQSRILRDPHFAAGTLLGAEGTPACVLIDAEGRVASPTMAGPRGVFEMLGFLPYVPTPQDVVDAMLRLAKVSGGDRIYDLGCGDGRILVTAAKKYGATGVGVDINPERLSEARTNARKASVESLVRFEEGQLMEMDFRDATVVVFYLLPKIILQLREKFLSDLRPGTRIVSHDFDMGEAWKPDQELEVEGSKIYLWIVPERA